MAAEVVWCNGCKTAVWAYDSVGEGWDTRGLLNMMGMPCPQCGATGNFDGWNSRALTLSEVQRALENQHRSDWWSVLRAVFKNNVPKGTWAISPDCYWFRRPGMTNSQYLGMVEYIRQGIVEGYRGGL